MDSDSCRKGHPWTPENTRISVIRGRETKQCRQCDKTAAQSRRDAARGDRPKGRVYTRKDLCSRGHPMEGDNVYWYETKADGRQRRCRACQEDRRQGYIAEGETVQPSKEECVNGHPMEGGNLFFGPTGHALCRACAVAATQRWQRKNRQEYLNSRRGRRRQESKQAYAVLANLIRDAYASTQTEEELLDRLSALVDAAPSPMPQWTKEAETECRGASAQ